MDREKGRTQKCCPVGLTLVEHSPTPADGEYHENPTKHQRREQAVRDVKHEVGEPVGKGCDSAPVIVEGERKHGQGPELPVCESFAGRRARDENPCDLELSNEKVAGNR